MSSSKPPPPGRPDLEDNKEAQPCYAVEVHNRFKILNDLLDKFKNPDNTATEGIFDQQACTQKKTTPRENRRRGRPSSQGSEEGRRAGAREAVQGSPRKADSGPAGSQRREGSGKNTSRDSRVGEEPPRLRGVRNDIRTGEVHQAHHSSRSSLDDRPSQRFQHGHNRLAGSMLPESCFSLCYFIWLL